LGKYVEKEWFLRKKSCAKIRKNPQKRVKILAVGLLWIEAGAGRRAVSYAPSQSFCSVLLHLFFLPRLNHKTLTKKNLR